MKIRLSYLAWFLSICLLFVGQACQNEPPELAGPQAEPPVQPPPQPRMDSSIAYLALGDSYTIGQSVSFKERWPIHLYDYLSGRSIQIDTPLFIARTGWTTNELQVAMASTTWLQDTFDLVSLLIGVNNQYRGYPFDRYEEEFLQLLQRGLRLVQGRKDRIFVV
ncbi:MAG: GDSL-type esterase/lipase family protein, partial [Bacteroidota bacterium]